MGRENKTGDQSQKETLEAPLYEITPNGKVAEEKKTPKNGKEKEPIGKEIKLEDKVERKHLRHPYIRPHLMTKWQKK